MWECGLKPKLQIVCLCNTLSLPMWECGLKRMAEAQQKWAEIVTPHVGVWIETLSVVCVCCSCSVTPHVGVWIETRLRNAHCWVSWSLPMWECGLKRWPPGVPPRLVESHSPCGSVD